MKKNIIKLVLILSFSVTSIAIMAQGAAPPPPPSGGIGQSGDQNQGGGGAPIGSGLGILLALGAAYGSKKVYKVWKDKDELES
jgi:hypothetical protein